MTVTPETIAVALGRTVPASGSPEHAQWAMWIGDALMLIKARLVGDRPGQFPSLADLDQENLDYVVREAVVAQVKRPDDATQVDIRVDDGSVGKTYRTSAGRVTIRDEWWDLLSPADSQSGAFSIGILPTRGLGNHAPWCDLMFRGADCSCGASLAGWPMYEPVD